MRVVLVAHEVPNTQHNAIGYVFRSLIGQLLESGHHVSCCFLIGEGPSESEQELRRRLDAVEALGVDVIALSNAVTPPQLKWHEIIMRLLLRPNLADLYPWVAWAPHVERALAGTKPDVLFIFETYQGLAATHGLTMAPRVALFGDPYHLPALYREQMHRGREPRSPRALARAMIERNRLKAMRQLLSGLDGGGAVAAHFVPWFRDNGFTNCRYLRNAVPDLGGPAWRARREAAPRPTKPKILLVGHKRGTATLAGLSLFAEVTLPILEERLGLEGFEVHVIGRYEPPADVAKKLARPSVRLRDFVEDIETEFLTADVFLVPTPIELGIRTRIIFGWSFGCCVIAHQVSALGIPEMRHEENALLAQDGAGLAEAILRALGDPALRQRLGEGGRQTYEQWFTPAVAGGRMVEELERAVRARGGQAHRPSRGAGVDVAPVVEVVEACRS